MSHFAWPTRPASPSPPAAFTELQMRFQAVCQRFPDCPRHISNSAAALRVAGARWDAVRCGIAVLGLSPFATSPADDGLTPALSFTTYVADVKLLQAGESSGYGRRFIATRPTWIGLAPAGYADGVPRVLSGRGDVLVRGRRRPVAATISMDQLTFVIGSERDVEIGDRVTLLGRDGDERVTAEEWARLADTINYEIATAWRRGHGAWTMSSAGLTDPRRSRRRGRLAGRRQRPRPAAGPAGRRRRPRRGGRPGAGRAGARARPGGSPFPLSEATGPGGWCSAGAPSTSPAGAAAISPPTSGSVTSRSTRWRCRSPARRRE